MENLDNTLACVKVFANTVSKETAKGGAILYTDNTSHGKITKEMIGPFSGDELVISSHKLGVRNENRTGFSDLTVEEYSIPIVMLTFKEPIRAVWVEYDWSDDFVPELRKVIKSNYYMSSAIFALTLKLAHDNPVVVENKINHILNLDFENERKFNAGVIKTKLFPEENTYFLVYKLTQIAPVSPNQVCPETSALTEDDEETDTGSDCETLVKPPPKKRQKTTSLGSQVLAMEERLEVLEVERAGYKNTMLQQEATITALQQELETTKQENQNLVQKYNELFGGVEKLHTMYKDN